MSYDLMQLSFRENKLHLFTCTSSSNDHCDHILKASAIHLLKLMNPKRYKTQSLGFSGFQPVQEMVIYQTLSKGNMLYCVF